MKKPYSDPLDILFYKLSDCVSDPLHKLNITPNMITIFSIFINGIVYRLLNTGQNRQAVVFILFHYFLDCLDGYMARKYKQFSVLGDYLDHISDIIFTINVLYQLYKNNSFNRFKWKIMIYICFVLLMMMHLGCQEKIANNKISPSLNITKKLCYKDSWVKYTRFFGPGTITLVLCILVLLK